MPKRIISGERVWNSRKIKLLQPEHRAEYAWIYPMALANGVFECSARNVWFTCYKNRQDITEEKVGAILADFQAVGLLFVWTEPDGSEWGYWTGAHSEYGLLPPASQLKTGHYTMGPEPPADRFAVYVQKHHLRTNGHGPGAEISTGFPQDIHRKSGARDLKSEVQHLANQKDIANLPSDNRKSHATRGK